MSDYAYFFLDKEQQDLFKLFRNELSLQTCLIPVQTSDVKQINLIMKAVLTDTPELFWFEGEWKYINDGNTHYVNPSYSIKADETHMIQNQIDEMCSALLETKLLNTEYERILYVYDWIISNVNYGLLNGRGQTIYDALIKRSAVCKGLSKSFQYLLKQMGCFSTLQEGTLDGTNKHVWNIVEINGRYYNVDVSMGFKCFSYFFDESCKNDIHRCFLVPNNQLSKYHRIWNLPWPSLNCNDAY